MLDITQLPPLELPTTGAKLLLHSCCAPCAGGIMARLQQQQIDFTVYFYNPNIHPQAEYLQRKQENLRFAQQYAIPFIDADYDRDNWFRLTRGYEHEPERGSRCTLCFDMRLVKTAAYAVSNGFSVFSSTLGISRWKDFAQINAAGHRAASKYSNLSYWDYNWRKQGGTPLMHALNKHENFYLQQYCGCAYSLRDTNKWRLANGRPPVTIPKSENHSQ